MRLEVRRGCPAALPILRGVPYHVTNRAREGVTLFDSAAAYRAFVELIEETLYLRPTRVLAFCVMPNHWHFVLWPETDDAVERFIGLLSLVHAKRFHQRHGTTGSRPGYPERFEALPIEAAPNLYRVIRYVERNPCAAGLSLTADGWPWSSAAPGSPIRLADWPAPRPPDWKSYVDVAIETPELKQIREWRKGQPRRRRRSPGDGFDW